MNVFKRKYGLVKGILSDTSLRQKSSNAMTGFFLNKNKTVKPVVRKNLTVGLALNAVRYVAYQLKRGKRILFSK